LATDYTKVLQSEFGQQALSFYTSTSNNIKSVHEEAQRIANDRKHASVAANQTTDPSSSVSDAATAATQPVDATSATGPRIA
jgi:hypothetical protein